MVLPEEEQKRTIDGEGALGAIHPSKTRDELTSLPKEEPKCGGPEGEIEQGLNPANAIDLKRVAGISWRTDYQDVLVV